MVLISGKWVLIIARRLNRPDGSFAGVAYAPLTLEYLSTLFSKLDVGTNGVVSLRDAEMSLIARHPQFNKPDFGVGSKMVSKELQALVQAGKTSGTYDLSLIHISRSRNLDLPHAIPASLNFSIHNEYSAPASAR